MHATWLTQDGVVFSDDAILYQVTLAATSAGAANVTVHNGLDATGPVLVAFETPASTTRTVRFGQGVEVKGGLYVDVGSNVKGVLVVWGR